MRLERIHVYKIRLPFKGDFSISRVKGLSSEIIVVELMAAQKGIRGYGEGVPVAFVTGETPDSAVEDVGRLIRSTAFPWELDDVAQVWGFMDTLPPGKTHNTAICALETALLDALGQYQGRSIVEYLPQHHLQDRVFYGGALTLGDRGRILDLCRLIKSLGLNRLRIKMGKDLEQNKAALETVNSILGHGCELRIDPNGVWDCDLAFKHLPLIEGHGVRVVEEPLERGAPGFADFARALISRGVSLMACESAPTLEDLEKIIHEGYYQMINVKLCRSGGFRRALRIIDYIREQGLSFQIGCTLGESGILSAAGRALCLVCGDAVNYDGSYDPFILEKNTTCHDVSFGYGGEAGPLEGTGLGVEVDPEALYALGGAPALSVSRH